MDWDNLRIFLELARSPRLMDAAERLGIDYSTVSRRIRRFEEQLDTQLFERSRQGYVLTAQGSRLLEFAEQMESTAHAASEELTGKNNALSGQIRLGATEAFGNIVLAPHLANFCARHPHIAVDLLPVPRNISLSKREADVVVTIERPNNQNYVVNKLTDYCLKLYATRDYLSAHPPIRSSADLAYHPLIGYVDDLVFSEELRYLNDLAPESKVVLRSTSVIAQYMVARRGVGLAVLPCFLAHQTDDLLPVLDEEVVIIRSFWLVTPEERRNLARVRALWNYLREMAERNRRFLMGDSREMAWLR